MVSKREMAGDGIAARGPSFRWDDGEDRVRCSMVPTLYILTNRPDGTLYIGVTGDLPARLAQHLRGDGSAFVRRYNLHRLVYAEELPDMMTAIAREKAMKAWKRAWKVELIERANPGWADLSAGTLRRA